MSEEDLHQTTMRGFQNKLLGKRKLEETRYKENWEKHREMLVTIMAPNLDKKYKNKSVKDLYPLPWDVKPVKKKQVDPDKFKKGFEYLDQRKKE